jgi:non-ribosomal peptide synthetase component F
LVRVLRPKRLPGCGPYFQVHFIFQNYPRSKTEWPGLEVTEYDIDTRTAKLDLSVQIEFKTDARIVFEYNTDLFRRETIERKMREYTDLLNNVLAEPNLRV